METENDLTFTDREGGLTFAVVTRHILLLLVTLCTSTVAGILFPFGKIDTLPDADPQTAGEIIDLLVSLPARYGHLIFSAVSQLFTEPGFLTYGLSFSLSLLFILVCHEMGHYIACRIYRVEATLPYFLPTPPMFGPAGTFGAFIKIMSPMPSRRAVFDIGVAGPIAGFIALIPVIFLGIYTFPALSNTHNGIVFTKPAAILFCEYITGREIVDGIGNPFFFAAWVGLLVTALNLIPSGQLDGGHAIYALFGEKVHRWTGRIAFVAMTAVSVAGWFIYNSPSGFLIAILLGVMMRVRHPRPWDQSPLGGKRRFIAVLTLVIFLLSFDPFPLHLF